jgi:hypothetical protein
LVLCYQQGGGNDRHVLVHEWRDIQDSGLRRLRTCHRLNDVSRAGQFSFLELSDVEKQEVDPPLELGRHPITRPLQAA